MWIGGYSLDLYCDNEGAPHAYNEFPHQYTGELGTDCRRRAREDGWILRPDGTAACPKCSGKTPRTHATR